MKPRGGTVTGATAATLAEARTATRASACASIQSGGTWEQVTDAVCEALNVSEPDLAVVFVDSHFAAHYGDVLRRIREATGARHLIGCSGQGVIGPSTEAEQEPAISVMTLDLPGVVLTPLALVDGVDPGDLDRRAFLSGGVRLSTPVQPHDHQCRYPTERHNAGRNPAS